jgi:hypothetical protein
VRIKPNCHEAMQELDLLEQDSEKGGELIDRSNGILAWLHRNYATCPVLQVR